jgi:hypothetical protein
MVTAAFNGGSMWEDDGRSVSWRQLTAGVGVMAISMRQCGSMAMAPCIIEAGVCAM